MNAKDTDRPTWRGLQMPLRNFRHVGPLTPEAEEWWQSFGRFLAAAQREWDRK